MNTKKTKLPIFDENGVLLPEFESLLRFTIRQWSSLNEQNEPDHQQLVKNWLEEDVKDFVRWNS